MIDLVGMYELQLAFAVKLRQSLQGNPLFMLRFPNQAPYDSEVEDNGFPFGDAGDIFSRFRFGGFGRSSPFNDMNDVFRGTESMLRHMDSMFRDMHSFGEYGGSFGRTTGQNDHEEKGQSMLRLQGDTSLVYTLTR